MLYITLTISRIFGAYNFKTCNTFESLLSLYEKIANKKAFLKEAYRRLPTVLASIGTRCQHLVGRGPQAKKFEQVSSLVHQMLLPEG